MNQSYIRHTNGDRVVLFIHGFLGSPKHFDTMVPLVPHDCAIYNIQLLGHGGSVRDFAEASMKEWKAQVDRVVRELAERYAGIKIVAHSMGTLFAIEAAVRYPAAIKELLLFQAPLKIAVSPAAIANTVRRIPASYDAGLAFEKARGVRFSFRFWEYLGWIPRYLELFAEEKRGRETIKRLTVPCTIFQSRNDELVSIRSVDYIPKRPNIRLHILENSGHFIYDDADFEQMKQAFLDLFQ